MQALSLEARGQVVLHTLRATVFSPDADERRRAELALAAQGIEPGFALVLSMIACAGAMVPEPGERQLAAVVLKKHVKEHWDRDGRAFSPPEVSEEEKAMVRQTLLGGLADDSSKVRTAIGMAIMAIANADYPHAWPDLITHLVALIKEGRSVNGGELQGCQHRTSGQRDSWDTARPDTLAQRNLRLCVNTSLSKEYLQHPYLPVSCWRVAVIELRRIATWGASCCSANATQRVHSTTACVKACSEAGQGLYRGGCSHAPVCLRLPPMARGLAAVHGALRCLALISSDIDEQQVPQVSEKLGSEGACGRRVMTKWQTKRAAVVDRIAPWVLKLSPASLQAPQ